MSPRSTERITAGIAAALAAYVAAIAPARANIRAPILEPKPPSSAARPLDGSGDGLTVLDETLTFRCTDAACDVEARYRIQASAAVTVTLAFVSPQPAPLSVRVGSARAAVDVSTAAAEPLGDRAIEHEVASLQDRHVTAVQARFSAALTAGENLITVTYQQPLGRREHGHSYWSKGKFTGLFRYELWPLNEWRRAPGFRVAGDVSIHRPPPSWWKRTFSTLRSVGCVGSELLRNLTFTQRGDELHLTFDVTEPIPRRLWCEIGDEDLVPGLTAPH